MTMKTIRAILACVLKKVLKAFYKISTLYWLFFPCRKKLEINAKNIRKILLKWDIKLQSIHHNEKCLPKDNALSVHLK